MASQKRQKTSGLQRVGRYILLARLSGRTTAKAIYKHTSAWAIHLYETRDVYSLHDRPREVSMKASQIILSVIYKIDVFYQKIENPKLSLSIVAF